MGSRGRVLDLHLRTVCSLGIFLNLNMSVGIGIKLNYSNRKVLDDSSDVSDLINNLSEFQIEKLTFLFKCFNQTNSGYIEEEDIETVNELFRNIAGWGKDDLNYISMVDNNRVFLECLLRQETQQGHGGQRQSQELAQHVGQAVHGILWHGRLPHLGAVSAQGVVQRDRGQGGVGVHH